MDNNQHKAPGYCRNKLVPGAAAGPAARILVLFAILLLTTTITGLPPLEAGSEPGGSPSRWVVALDPGHSAGCTPGVIDPDTGLDVTDNQGAPGERQAMWELALKTRDRLEEAGFEVRLTKQAPDQCVNLKERAEVGNSCHVMVRLHYDPGLHALLYPAAGQYKEKAGRRTYVDSRVAEGSRELALSLFHFLRETGVTRLMNDVGGTSANQGPAFVGSVLSRVPVVLVENNPAVVRDNPAGQDAVAAALTLGLLSYFEKAKPVPVPPGPGEPQRFDEFILVQNPGVVPATVEASLYTPAGPAGSREITLEPGSRHTIWLNRELPNQEISVMLRSDEGVVAERSMYFNHQGRGGGSSTIGLSATSSRWYFAEGYTGPGFDTYILVFNPGDEETEVQFNFHAPGRQTASRALFLPAHSRGTIRANDVPGLADTEFSTTVESTGHPVVSERSMYFDYEGRAGGHAEQGVAAPRTAWHFAEGYSSDRFDTYLLVYNPSEEPASCLLELHREGGPGLELPFSLPEKTRRTFRLGGFPGFEHSGVSAVITSGTGLVAERVMYFDHHGRSGGSAASGAPGGGTAWYLAEGCTLEGFDTYLLLFNPGDQPAAASLLFSIEGGRQVPFETVIPPQERITLHLNRILDDSSFSTVVESTLPILVERSMYFDFNGISGGHSSSAAPSTAGTWYFGEGFTCTPGR